MKIKYQKYTTTPNEQISNPLEMDFLHRRKKKNENDNSKITLVLNLFSIMLLNIAHTTA